MCCKHKAQLMALFCKYLFIYQSIGQIDENLRDHQSYNSSWERQIQNVMAILPSKNHIMKLEKTSKDHQVTRLHLLGTRNVKISWHSILQFLRYFFLDQSDGPADIISTEKWLKISVLLIARHMLSKPIIKPYILNSFYLFFPMQILHHWVIASCLTFGILTNKYTHFCVFLVNDH